MPSPCSGPPVAARKPVTTTLHGHARSDDYAWLKDPDWQRVMREPEALDPEIRAYLEAENAHTEAFLAPHAALRQALVAEMRGRMKEDDSSVPAPDGAWAYYVRHVEGGEHPLYCRTPRDDRAEALLLDGNREAEGEAYFSIGDCEHSPDHRRLAYTLDTSGAERYRLFVRDIASGAVIDGPIEDAHGEVVWAADGETVFYTVLDENHRPWQVRRHRVGRLGRGPRGLRGVRPRLLPQARRVRGQALRDDLGPRPHHLRGASDRVGRRPRARPASSPPASAASSTTSPCAGGCSTS